MSKIIAEDTELFTRRSKPETYKLTAFTISFKGRNEGRMIDAK